MTGQITVAILRRYHDRPSAFAARMKATKGIHGCVVQMNISNVAGFASQDGDLTPHQVNAVPRQPVLLTPALALAYYFQHIPMEDIYMQKSFCRMRRKNCSESDLGSVATF